METKVTLFELFISLAPMLVALVGAFIHMKVNVGSLKTQMEYLQKELNEEKEGNKMNYQEISGKIDKIFGLISEVKIMVAEKTSKN